MKETLAKDQDKFVLRLPAGMRKRIKAAADRNNRSMNSEIVATLDETYGSDDFDFPGFMQAFMVPVMMAATAEERAQLISEANAFLMSQESDMEVTETVKPTGEAEIKLKTSGYEFAVGPATELIVP